MLVAGQLGAVWRYTYHGSERSSFSSKLKEWWKSTFLDSWTEVPEISLSLKITGGEKKKKHTGASGPPACTLDCDPSCQNKTGWCGTQTMAGAL